MAYVQSYKVKNFQNYYTLDMSGGTGTSTGTWTVVESIASFPTSFPVVLEIWDTDETFNSTVEFVICSAASVGSKQLTISSRGVDSTSAYAHANGSKIAINITALPWNNMVDNVEQLKTDIVTKASTTDLTTTNGNVTTTNGNVTALTTRVDTLETRTQPTVGTAGTAPTNNGTSTSTARLDHEHKVFYHFTPIIQSPSSGSTSVLFANKTALTFDIVSFYAMTTGTVATTLTTISLEKMSQSIVDGAFTPWTTITAPNLTIDANERSSNTAATPVTIGTTTLAAGEHLRMNVIAAGSGIGDIQGFVVLKLKNTN